MKKSVAPPYYLKIANDIASRVAGGEFAEGQRIYGRSVMASEYKTSPETIRRALKLLADMKVIDIKPQSGAVVLSQDNAVRYVNNFDDSGKVLSLLHRLHELRAQYNELNGKIIDTVDEIIHTRYSFAAANEPLPNYEVNIPEGSWIVGQSIGGLKFWQSTGATIVAIRRGQHIILSPGPYAQLYDGDAIILVGTPAASEAAARLVSGQEESHDNIPACK